MLQALAKRISQTKLGQRALAQPEGWEFLKEKPTPRFYLGLGLIVFSFLFSLPALGYCAYLAARWENAWIAVIGVPAIIIAVHLIFALGAWLAGGNYAAGAFLLACKIFIRKYGEKNVAKPTQG
jgi:hypothetical protein